MNQTFIYKNEQQLGPFDDATILQSLNNGSFDSADLCWREGWAEWKTLEAIYPKPGNLKNQPASTADEEKTVWEGRPSMLNYIGMWTLGVITLPIGIGFIIIICLLWSYYSKRYVISNKRVTLVIGILVKSSNQLRVKDIRSINVSKKGLGALIFGMGSIELSTAATDKAEVVFSGIKNADEVRDLISGLQG
jgi:membrane protein YdbS with pleckstrin-like domain